MSKVLYGVHASHAGADTEACGFVFGVLILCGGVVHVGEVDALGLSCDVAVQAVEFARLQLNIALLGAEVDVTVGAGDGATGVTDLVAGATLFIAHFAKRDTSERAKAALGFFAVVVLVKAVFGGGDVDVAIGADHVNTVGTKYRAATYVGIALAQSGDGVADQLAANAGVGIVTVNTVAGLGREETGFLDVGFAVVVVGLPSFSNVDGVTLKHQKPRREYRRGFWVVMVDLIHGFSNMLSVLIPS